MLKFKQFLAESAGANLHLEHLEDEPLNGGVVGTRGAINFLQSLRDMLAGHSTGQRITVKWDGAPAVFCGYNPENGKFFVGSKSVFNVTPKINYTNADIDRNHPPGLGEKLKVALLHLKKIFPRNFGYILQGDMMYDKALLRTQNIDGISYITFTPNTITYAVPENSSLATQINASKMGIVFHTVYTGNTMKNMRASFGASPRLLSGLKKSRDVWFTDVDLPDLSGKITFDNSETGKITSILSEMGSLFKKIPADVLNAIAEKKVTKSGKENPSNYNIRIKAHYNSKIRQGELIADTQKHVEELISIVTRDIQTAKTSAGQQTKKDFAQFFIDNKQHLINIFRLQNLIVEAKMMIVKKLESIKGLTSTFVRTGNGYKVTNPEGFVAIDRFNSNRGVKLVDRLEFSKNNFTVPKNWD